MLLRVVVVLFCCDGKRRFHFSCIVLKIEQMKHLIMLSNLCLLHSTVSATQSSSQAREIFGVRCAVLL